MVLGASVEKEKKELFEHPDGFTSGDTTDDIVAVLRGPGHIS